MKCEICNREDTLFDVYLERKGEKDRYLRTLCCKCGGLIKNGIT